MARNPPDDEALRDALRTLARFVAPYVKELLDDVDTPELADELVAYDEDSANELAQGLPADVRRDGAILFKALMSPPHELDTIKLADLTELSTRELSGRLLRPIQQRAKALGLPKPWDSVRVAPKGDLGARTVLRGDRETAVLLHRMFELTVPKRATSAKTQSRSLLTPLPSAVFVFAPEYAEALSEPVDGESSVLRDSRPGSRGVIYRAHSDQKIVAMFDVETEAYWDDEFGYMARGHFTPLAKPIARAELLSNETLEPVFRHIQGRRRLPPPAQEAMAEFIQTVGKTPLPHHSMHESRPQERRRGRRG